MAHQQALGLIKAGNLNGAARVLGEQIKSGKATADTFRLASQVAFKQTQYAPAHSLLAMLAKVAKLTNDDLVARASIELALADINAANNTLSLVKLADCTSATRVSVSGLYEQLGDFDQAIKLIEPLVLKGAGAQATEQLLGQWLAAGMGDKGINLLLSLNKPSAKAIWIATHYHDQTDHAPFIKQHLDKATSNQDKIWLGFALARAQERAKQFDLAWHSMQQANALKRQLISNADIERATKTISHYQAQGQALQIAPAPSAAIRPIFIVGAPRAGTTLLGRMLGQLPSASYIGEQPYIGQVAPALLAGKVAPLKAQQFYLHHVGQRVAKGAGLLIDDHPYNFLFIEAIKAMFDDAIIIAVKREPFDQVMANYKTCFGDQAEPQSYCFESLCQYIDQVNARLSTDRVISVNYEQLVSDPQLALAPVFDKLGTDYNPVVTDFYKDTSAITTASTVQARQPLNTKSVGYKDRYPDAFARYQLLSQ